MEGDTTLKDKKRYATLKRNCDQYGIEFAEPSPNESQIEKEARISRLENEVRKERKRLARKSKSTEAYQQELEQNRVRKRNQSVEAQDREKQRKRLERKHQSPERKEHERLRKQNEWKLKSPERKEHERLRKQIERKNHSPERKEHERIRKQNERNMYNAEQKQREKEKNQIRMQARRENEVGKAAQKQQSNQVARRGALNVDTPNTSNAGIVVPEISVDIKGSVVKALAVATRTQRKDGNHQASVCVICDRLIIGVESIHSLSEQRIRENQLRLSVKTYEEFYGHVMNPILVSQYQVDGFPGLLLSPRSYQDGGNFECCSSCFTSLMPSKAKEAGKKPPKHAIANGFAIGHIPSALHIEGEDEPRQQGLSNKDISDVMCAAVARQRPYAFIFAFMGGAHQSLMGQVSFFEMDQSHIGGVINHYRSTGANDHILCVLAGRFTPKQKEIARSQAILDTKLYIDLMTWLIRCSGHEGFQGVTPPEECPQPRLLEDQSNDNNTDESQDASIENEYGGSTYTFTSSHDPSENIGVYRNNSEFTAAILNRESPLLLAHGGRFVSSGRELRLEMIFPIQFPFGTGGPKMKRPTQISEIECFKHYFRLSLAQFMRGDFILVVLHMFNRIKSFQSGLITCRSSRINGMPFAEVIATLTEDQIKKAAENLSKGYEDTSIAGQFLRKAETSCKSIGYTAAAARANRRLMYAMCDRYGIPDIFFSLTPDDEGCYRVRLYAGAGKSFGMPSLDCSDADCIADFRLRRDTRMKYPGACAIEYQSVVQIALKVLFGWDSEKQCGNKGIFGKLIAYAVAHEEQGRKTLHGHWLLWVESLNELRRMIFHPVLEVRSAAREQYKKYIDDVMSSEFTRYGLKTMHSCEPARQQELVCENAVATADELFYDYNQGHSDEAEQLQRIRNTRSKYKKKEICGKILTCRHCEALFSTDEIVNMSLAHHLERIGNVNVTLPIHDKRLELAAYRYPYDYKQISQQEIAGDFWGDPEVRDTLLRLQVDQHDWRHRPSCFKKGPECRFHFGKRSCVATNLGIEDQADDESNVTKWYRLDDSIDTELFTSTPYLVETKRSMGCQFLNTHSVPVSAVFGCNTNVQIGEPCHLFYTTAYAFKNTQKDDADRFILIGTKVCRRLMRMRSIALENGTTETSTDEVGDAINHAINDKGDWSEGLSRMLSGMCANLSKAVCSSTMGHLIVSNDGSRFQYSHNHTNLLVSQAIDILDGKEGDFRIRTNYSKALREKVVWPDSTFDDYIHRPSDLDQLCYYEFVANYEKICKGFKQMDRKNRNANHDNEDCVDLSNNEYPFQETHPGYEFSHLKKRKHEVVPVISLPENSLCRIKELEIRSDTLSSIATEKREVYAKTALVMFMPFRSLHDLQQRVSGRPEVYWSKLMSEIKNDGAFWSTGVDILHNIEERETAQKMKSAVEPLAKQTKYQKTEEEEKEGARNNTELHPNAVDFSLFDDDEERLIDNDYHVLEGYTQRTERTHGHLIDSGDIKKDQIIPARISNENSLICTEVESTQARQISETLPTASSTALQYSFATLMTFVDGALIGGNYDSYAANDSDGSALDRNIDGGGVFQDLFGNDPQQRIPTLYGVAHKVAQQEGKRLDKKQYIAYEIIACSFLLCLIEDAEMNCSSPLHNMEVDKRDTLIQQLQARGGKAQLIMFLTGFAGAGKSTCVKVAQRFCFEFCRAVSIPWYENTFLFTATTGSAAALFQGQTIHDAAFLNGNEKNISNKKRKEWENVRILIIDEISFFTRANLEKLDRRLKNILGRQDRPFGGVAIVFSGDFHQLRPVKCDSHGILYEGLMNGLFEGSINTAIILENSHRFDEDPEFGALLKRLWKGELTEDDIEWLNTRLVGRNGISLPQDSTDADTCFACPKNKQRNAISAGIFQQHLQSGLFPTVDSNELPPDHTIIIEADIQSCTSDNNTGKTRVSRELKDRILSTCGDSQCVTGQNKKVDPCLRFYPGAHAMCNDNSKLKSDNIGNGTLCRVKQVKLKNGAPPLQWKNWDGYKVYTVNARYVEWAEFERFPDIPKIVSIKAAISELEENLEKNDGIDRQKDMDKLQKELQILQTSQCFKLSPTKSSAYVHVTLDDAVTEQTVFKGVSMTQLPINMNDATTGHKLQGMSKDKLIIASWSFIPNWIYVVLSRVRTLKGLFLLKPLPTNCLDKFQVPRSLQAFERRMQDLERQVIEARERNMAELDQTI